MLRFLCRKYDDNTAAKDLPAAVQVFELTKCQHRAKPSRLRCETDDETLVGIIPNNFLKTHTSQAKYRKVYM